MLFVSAVFVLTVSVNFRYHSYTVIQDSGSVAQFVGFFVISLVSALVIFLILLAHTIATNNGHGRIGRILVRVFWCIALPYSAVFGDFPVVRADQWAAALVSALAATWLVLGGHVTQTMEKCLQESARKNNSRLAVDSVQSGAEVIPYHLVAVVFVLGMQVIPLFYQ